MGMKGIWSFFANSHGKSRCNVIGGTIKGLTPRESFQRFCQGQILTAMDMKKICQEKVLGITAIFREEIQ